MNSKKTYIVYQTKMPREEWDKLTGTKHDKPYGFDAGIIVVSEFDNLVSVLRRIRWLTGAAIAPTKKEAQREVECYRASWESEGEYIYGRSAWQ